MTQDVFYDGKLGKIYRAISGLYDRNVKPDMVTVARELISSGDLDEVGGAIALSELSAGMASGANIVDHSRYLHQLWIARRLAVAGMEITARASDPSNDIDDTLAQSLGDIEAIAVNTAYGSRMSVISSVARDCLENYQNRKERARNGQIQGVSTGLRKLDRLTTGWKGGQLIILAARPAMGKTSFLLHLAKSAAMGGTPVVIFSLEMSGSSLGDRLILSECDVNGDEYKAGTSGGGRERDMRSDRPYIVFAYIRGRYAKYQHAADKGKGEKPQQARQVRYRPYRLPATHRHAIGE